MSFRRKYYILMKNHHINLSNYGLSFPRMKFLFITFNCCIFSFTETFSFSFQNSMSHNKVRSAVVQAINRPELRFDFIFREYPRKYGSHKRSDGPPDPRTSRRGFLVPQTSTAVQNALGKGGVFPKGKTFDSCDT